MRLPRILAGVVQSASGSSQPALIDLRSDTVTRPSTAMRAMMAGAEVGDDVYGEDPTVNRLQERAAALLGKQAALFVPSGTMANQICVRVHTSPGDEVLLGEGAHNYFYETGAGAAISGVQYTVLGHGGLFSAADVVAAIKPDESHFPRTRLVLIENTHNRSGGRIFPLSEILAVAEVARAAGLRLHLDGARIWNAAAATGIQLAEWAAPFDSVACCLSKGLGAPVGSLVAGSRQLVGAAHRMRKMLGGGMRQAGVLAAAGLYALEHNRGRLLDDHANARWLANELCRLPGIVLDPAGVETNIVLFDLAPGAPAAAELAARLRQRGVLVSLFGPRRIRLVTHLDVDRAACDKAVAAVAAILAEAQAKAASPPAASVG